MLRNYLKTTYKLIRKDKVYSVINVAGLAIGIVGSLLILVYVAGQLSYESMHKNRNNIVRVSVKFGSGNGTMNLAGAMSALGPAATAQIPEVRSAVRFRLDRKAQIKVGDKKFVEQRFFFADSNVFNVFTFPLVEGNKKFALKDPSSIVISQAIAKKYFGDADPIGKKIIYDNKYTFVVSGVMKNVPKNTMLRCQLIAPFSRILKIKNLQPTWNSFGSTYTYLFLKKGTSISNLHKKLRALLEQNTNKQFASMLHFIILPLKDIYLKSHAMGELEPTGNLTAIYLFTSFAFLVLVIACLNFINLSTVKSLHRSKEVGVRKVMGARRRNLIVQFFAESLIITLISVVISLLIFMLANPLLNNYFNVQLSVNPFKTYSFYIILLGVIAFVSLFSGTYPAVFLSKFNPIDSIKSFKTPGFSHTVLRKFLVVVQFAITIFLIIGTATVYKQLHFMRNSDLGFNKKNVIIVNFPVSKKRIQNKYPVMKQAFQSISGVTDVSGAYSLPGVNNKEVESVRIKGAPGKVYNMLQSNAVDYNFIPMLGLKILKGRNFSRQYATDKSQAIILNETAVKDLGLRHPVGAEVFLPGNKEIPAKVIGVVNDFHIASFHKKIEPLFLYVNRKNYYHIALKINPKYKNSIVASLKKEWQNILPGIQFNYSFLSQTYDNLYESDAKSGSLFTLFSFLSILIACMGLFGLVSYSTEVRQKEIGIRKVNGATVLEIVGLLIKEFVKWVGIAFVLATPIAYYALPKWLQNFAYKTSLSWWIFVLAGLGIMLIAMGTVSWQTFTAARKNPVESLRYE